MSAIALGEQADWQAVADGMMWEWDEKTASPVGCAAHPSFPSNLALRVTQPHGGRDAFRLELLEGNDTLYSWNGHARSVFFVFGDLLYLADYSPSGAGGQIECVNLRSGEDVWCSQLKGTETFMHSLFRNAVTMRPRTHDVLEIRGETSHGRYVEFKDMKTGTTLGHRKWKIENRRTSH